MAGKVLLTFAVAEFLFLLNGGLIITFALIAQNQISSAPNVTNVAINLLLTQTPLSALIGNAVIVFITFLLSVPALLIPLSKGWLQAHGFMIIVCMLFTLVNGLYIWFCTLKTRTDLMGVWTSQPASVQSLLQQQFSCCGYFSSTSPTFITDSTCTSAAVAAIQPGCVTPFSSYANNYLNIIFTAAFGIVGEDVALILATAMLIKDRKEKARYRHIDEKNGFRVF